MAVPRPKHHFTPPSGWMNDPNGLVWHAGVFHLFYQYHPHSLVWGPMHWGHAVSRDLLSWEPLPVALEPVPLGTIFSGSAVWDGDNTCGLVPGGGLVALFSYHTQAQGLAFSTDGGVSWSHFADNPVIASPGRDFRDPKVFRDGDHWTAVLAAGDHIEFFRSHNLTAWALVGRFDATVDVGVWECPDLFPLEGPDGRRWVLLLSGTDRAPAGGSGTLYWVGDWDGQAFRPEAGPSWLDAGPDNYAGVTWNDAPEGRLFVGWMNNWKYAKDIPADTWRGAMTLPRELSLSPKGPWLVQKPVDALDSRRGRPRAFGEPMSAHSDVELTLFAESDTVVLTWSKPNARLRLTWSPATGRLELDRRRDEGVPDAWIATMGTVLKATASKLSLRLIFDSLSVEVFAEGGLTVFSALLFPPEGLWAVEASGGHIVGTVWDLD